MIYTEKMVMDAQMIASTIHKNETYDDYFPYYKHLADVVSILEDYSYSRKYVIAAWLHDTLESGGISYTKIKLLFGLEIAEIVYAVSSELGRNRKESNEKTYSKIKSNPDATIVKLADRIANVVHGGKSKMYVSEHQNFKDSIRVSGVADELWKELDLLTQNNK